VLSLILMARRVHKRGHFGSKASAVLRSAYPMVLGLGGWLLGALIVLATMPGVPIDDELVVALSAGLPVGMGIFLAWVHRDWDRQTKSVGLAAAVGSALVAAWLGFPAMAGFMAPITAILGAIAGANLVLILLDMARTGFAEDRISAGMATNTRTPSTKSKSPTGAGMR
jgi:hypothetical protein